MLYSQMLDSIENMAGSNTLAYFRQGQRESFIILPPDGDSCSSMSEHKNGAKRKEIGGSMAFRLKALHLQAFCLRQVCGECLWCKFN
jgi:hypothetical protein